VSIAYLFFFWFWSVWRAEDLFESRGDSTDYERSLFSKVREAISKAQGGPMKFDPPQINVLAITLAALIAALAPPARAEVNYDDPNLARAPVFAAEAAAICAQQATKGARAMESCVRNYGLVETNTASEAVYLVNSTNEILSSDEDLSTRKPATKRTSRTAK
jgi:hypothetical protein